MNLRQIKAWSLTIATRTYTKRREILRILALIASIANGLAFIPQLVKILETHSVRDLSLATYTSFAVVGIIILSHLYLEGNWYLGLGVGLTLFFTLTIQALIVHFGTNCIPLGVLLLVYMVTLSGAIVLMIFYVNALRDLWKLFMRFLDAR
ncbi:MAG: PQ-loop domain-containing transporter [bacterium]|nr:PQ-loop domain-containing transporter [bacterium]